MTVLRQFFSRRGRTNLNHSVAEVSRLLDGRTLRMLDVGAAEGAPKKWLPFSPMMEYIAVEPDPRSASALAEASDSSFRKHSVISEGLWSSQGEIDLHLCRKPMASSAYRPNVEFAKLFPDSQRFDVVGVESMAVTTVDAYMGDNNRIDAMKLDVQGAEYEVLRGASNALTSTLLVEAEVEFVPLYERQPLFADVTTLLAARGLEFIDFLFLYRWHPEQLDGTGQTVFADALFMRAPEQMSNEDDEFHRFAALSVIYGRGDLLLRLSRVARDKTLRSLLESSGHRISRLNSRSNRRLQVMGRALRTWHLDTRGHLFH